MITRRTLHPLLRRFGIAVLALPFAAGFSAAQAQTRKPKILLIFGDDVDQANISAYAHGVVGYQTPNIDRHLRGIPAEPEGRRLLARSSAGEAFERTNQRPIIAKCSSFKLAGRCARSGPLCWETCAGFEARVNESL